MEIENVKIARNFRGGLGSRKGEVLCRRGEICMQSLCAVGLFTSKLRISFSGTEHCSRAPGREILPVFLELEGNVCSS